MHSQRHLRRQHEPVGSSYGICSANKDKWYFCGRRIRSTDCNSSPISVGNSALGYLQGRYAALARPGALRQGDRFGKALQCRWSSTSAVCVCRVCIGLLGIARSMNDMGMRTHGSLGNRQLQDVTSACALHGTFSRTRLPFVNGPYPDEFCRKPAPQPECACFR